jgi:type III pantothenate kinase
VDLPALDTLLVLEVGNSGAKVGAVRGEDVAGPVRMPGLTGRVVREFAAPLLKGREAVIAIAGSDPARVDGLLWEVDKLRLGLCVKVGPDHPGLAPARVTHPLKAGVDRRVQVMAAVHLAGTAAAVVSCGTALTVDLGDEGGALLGGAIAPGIGLAFRALAEGTARLPLVEPKGEARMPGRDTESAVRAGVLHGSAGAVERLLEEAGVGPGTPVYLTGQDAPLLKDLIRREVRLHAGLALLGVALAVRAAPPKSRGRV